MQRKAQTCNNLAASPSHMSELGPLLNTAIIHLVSITLPPRISHIGRHWKTPPLMSPSLPQACCSVGVVAVVEGAEGCLGETHHSDGALVQQQGEEPGCGRSELPAAALGRDSQQRLEPGTINRGKVEQISEWLHCQTDQMFLCFSTTVHSATLRSRSGVSPALVRCSTARSARPRSRSMAAMSR